MILLFHLASARYQVLDEMHRNKLGNPFEYLANIKPVWSLDVASILEN
jgi:hypothetical protein